MQTNEKGVSAGTADAKQDATPSDNQGPDTKPAGEDTRTSTTTEEKATPSAKEE